eukprot:gene13315-9151_t
MDYCDVSKCLQSMYPRSVMLDVFVFLPYFTILLLFHAGSLCCETLYNQPNYLFFLSPPFPLRSLALRHGSPQPRLFLSELSSLSATLSPLKRCGPFPACSLVFFSFVGAACFFILTGLYRCPSPSLTSSTNAMTRDMENEVTLPLSEACTAAVLHAGYTPQATRAIQLQLSELLPYQGNFASLEVLSNTDSSALLQLRCSLAVPSALRSRAAGEAAREAIEIIVQFPKSYPAEHPAVSARFKDPDVAAQLQWPEEMLQENCVLLDGHIALDRLEALLELTPPFPLLNILIAVKELFEAFTPAVSGSPRAPPASPPPALTPEQLALIQGILGPLLQRIHRGATTYLLLRQRSLPVLAQEKKVGRRMQSACNTLAGQEAALRAYLPRSSARLPQLLQRLEESVPDVFQAPVSSRQHLLEASHPIFDKILHLRAEIEANNDVLRLLDQGLHEQHLSCDDYLKHVMHTARSTFHHQLQLRLYAQQHAALRNAGCSYSLSSASSSSSSSSSSDSTLTDIAATASPSVASQAPTPQEDHNTLPSPRPHNWPSPTGPSTAAYTPPTESLPSAVRELDSTGSPISVLSGADNGADDSESEEVAAPDPEDSQRSVGRADVLPAQSETDSAGPIPEISAALAGSDAAPPAVDGAPDSTGSPISVLSGADNGADDSESEEVAAPDPEDSQRSVGRADVLPAQSETDSAGPIPEISAALAGSDAAPPAVDGAPDSTGSPISVLSGADNGADDSESEEVAAPDPEDSQRSVGRADVLPAQSETDSAGPIPEISAALAGSDAAPPAVDGAPDSTGSPISVLSGADNGADDSESEEVAAPDPEDSQRSVGRADVLPAQSETDSAGPIPEISAALAGSDAAPAVDGAPDSTGSPISVLSGADNGADDSESEEVAAPDPEDSQRSVGRADVLPAQSETDSAGPIPEISAALAGSDAAPPAVDGAPDSTSSPISVLSGADNGADDSESEEVAAPDPEDSQRSKSQSSAGEVSPDARWDSP